MLHLISDALIMISYYSIPVALVYFVRKRKGLEFHWMFICFAVFIMACGTSHLMDIVTIWYPMYWLSGTIKAITAIASITTAYLLINQIPFALALPSPAALEVINKQLRREIAERKEIEQTLHQKNLELATLNTELEAFSYSVSHDLRGPLRSMDGFSLALLEDYSDKLDADGQDALHRIRAASQRMGRLIDDMLRLSQVTRVEVKEELIDLSILASRIANTVQSEQPERLVEWIIDDHMTLFADKSLTQIVMQNLIENAWKFTSKTDRAVIKIGVIDRPEGKTYFVADNGAGFDMLHVDQLFGAFHRLHHVADFPGTGIGLAIVQRIIHRHDGRIWVEAKQNEGATFFFTVREAAHDQPTNA
jgi:light-regulated signal transduction histidine kinase (bacteriophytochrome)